MITKEELKRALEAIARQQAELGDYDESADRLARALAHSFGLDSGREMYFSGGPIRLPQVSTSVVLVQPAQTTDEFMAQWR